jgi:tetratricopeptide (TPR) repeat protein
MPNATFFPARPDRRPLGFVLTEFPFPVAVAYARLQGELDRQEPVAAAWQLLDAFQSLLKFAAALTVADCLRGRPDPGLVGELVALLFKPLSLGDWRDLAEKPLRPLEGLARAGRLADSGRLLPGLYGVFFNPKTGKRSPLARKVFEQMDLVNWRNKVFGHGVFRHDHGFYAGEVLRWLPLLDELYQELRPVLAGWALVGRAPGGEEVVWQGAPDLPPVQPHAHRPWGDPVPMLLRRPGDPGAAELPLGPLLTVQDCSVCRQPAAFFFEGNEHDPAKGRHRTYFVEYFAGHGNRLVNWPEARRLADQLPPGFEWERASYNWKEAAAAVAALFRSFEDEYRRPGYLLDAFWQLAEERPAGYVHLAGPAGCGKTFVVRGLQQEGRERGVSVLAYHILPGALGDYRTFISELADRAREQLAFRTQEVQTKVARLSDLQEQLAEFLAGLMRANGLDTLVLALDALDELREPEAGGALISDFLPPAGKLPRGCVVLLTSREELRPRVRERLEQLRRGGPGAFAELAVRPEGEANRALLRAYLRGELPESFRHPGDVEEVLRRSGGVFLYAYHLSRALRSGAFADTAALPAGEWFYPAYLARLREQAGAGDYEQVYLRTLLLLAAAQQPVTLEQLQRWEMHGERLELVLRDLADFLRVHRGRRWHDSLNDDGDNRYEMAHEAFVRYVRGDAGLSEQYRRAHGAMADAALAAHHGRWHDLDPYDDPSLYDLRFLPGHLRGAARDEEAGRLLGDQEYLGACRRVGQEALERRRSQAAVGLFRLTVGAYRGLVQAGRRDLADGLALALNNLGAALRLQGDLAEAESACREAISVYRGLVQAGRQDLANDLAGTLVNLGNALADQGELAGAVAEHREAVGIRRRLVQAGRTDLTGDLARALDTLGASLRDLREPAQAVATHREAIGIFRGLVQAGRREAASDLARGLINLGNALADQGEPEAAAVYREAIGIYRGLVEAGRRELANELARALNNLGAALVARGEPAEAVAAYREAVGIRRRLVQAGRTELASDLARTLNELGVALAARGEPAEAAEACREAVAIYRGLVQAGRWELSHHLALALLNDGLVRDRLGQAQEALVCFNEAIKHRQRLVSGGLTHLLPLLIKGLRIRCGFLGRQRDWVSAAQDVRLAFGHIVPFLRQGTAPEPLRREFDEFVSALRQLSTEDRAQLASALEEDAALVRLYVEPHGT